eukprot:6855660-Alexandrium_andersonii.AAC.1
MSSSTSRPPHTKVTTGCQAEIATAAFQQHWAPGQARQGYTELRDAASSRAVAIQQLITEARGQEEN